MLDRYKAIAPTVEFVAASFLVVFLVYFLLQEREQLRDKMLRMAGRANLTVTTQAIGETTFRDQPLPVHDGPDQRRLRTC